MSVKIVVKGIRKTRRFLRKNNKNIKIKVSQAMVKAGAFMQGEVKESIAGRKAEPTSVDTGRFLNSIDFRASEDNAIIFTGIPYAKFLEFGTSRFTARRHFNNSKDRNKQKIRQIINSQLKTI